MLVPDDVGLVVGREQERDELLDLAIVERPGRIARVRPDRHLGERVTTDIAATDGQHIPDVRLVEVAEQLLLAVQGRALPALAVHAVTTRAIRLVDEIAALDPGHLLGIDLHGLTRRREPARGAQLVEPVQRDEQDDDDQREEADPACVGRLTNDLGSPFRRELDPADRR